eukprot:gene30-42_t
MFPRDASEETVPNEDQCEEAEDEESTTTVRQLGDSLYIVSSAEAYAMVAGNLFESLRGKLPGTHATVDWEEVHLRVTSDSTQFRFDAQHLVAVVKEQKRFTSMHMTSKEDAVATDERVFNDMAYMLGALASQDALLVCLTKRTEAARACATFLQKLSTSNTGPTLAIVDANEVAVRHAFAAAPSSFCPSDRQEALKEPVSEPRVDRSLAENTCPEKSEIVSKNFTPDLVSKTGECDFALSPVLVVA